MNAMNYNALTVGELGRLAISDAGARQFIADNAEQIILEAEDSRGTDWEIFNDRAPGFAITAQGPT